MAKVIQRIEAAGGSMRQGGSTAMRGAFKRSLGETVEMTFSQLSQAQSAASARGLNTGRVLDTKQFDPSQRTIRRLFGAGTPSPGLPGVSAAELGIKTTADDIISITFNKANAGATAVNTRAAVGTGGKVMMTGDFAEDILAGKARAELAKEGLERGFFRTLGARNAFKAMGSKEGAKLAFSIAAPKALAVANPILTAAAVYDISKLAAEKIIGGGAKLTRDAFKSLQGTINKPMFGMGYVDNEVAATSRARGVMAIQNSRLNARSALGSEGAMLASHFG